MKIAAGRLKGKNLFGLKDRSVRPTKNIVREAIFDSLRGRLEGRKVLDLFAGTGALGIEAISQGAGQVVFVEQNRPAADAIGKNIAALGLESAARLRRERAETALAALAGERFDLALADPPYEYSDEALAELLSSLTGRGDVTAGGALVVIEHRAGRELPDTPGLRRVKTKKYGRTAVTFFEKT